jgi:hypothetical protein
MPSSMQKFVKRSLPGRELSDKISLGVDTVTNHELPKLPQGKRLTCPSNTTISEVIKFLSDALHFEKHIICISRDFDPLQHIEMVLPVQLKKSGSKESSKD